MELVDILDIDGYRWDIKDAQAREDISGLKSDTKIVYVGEMDLNLKQGYTASFAKLQHVMKMGKLISGTIHFIGLEGPGLTESKPVAVAALPFLPRDVFEVVAVDTWKNNSFRVSGNAAGVVHIISTEKFISGVSDIIGSFVCFEA